MLYLVYEPVSAFTDKKPDHLMMLFYAYINKKYMYFEYRCHVYSSWYCISAQEQQYNIRPSSAAIQLSDRQRATKGFSDQQAERTHC